MHYQSIVTGALVLKALVTESQRSKQADKRIKVFEEWLLNCRRGRAWVTTLDSAYAVFALCDLVKKVKPAAVAMKVNGQSLAAKDFSAGVQINSDMLKIGDNVIELQSSSKLRVHVTASLRYFSSRDVDAETQSIIHARRVLERAVIDKAGVKKWLEVADGAAIKRGTELRLKVTIEADEDIPFVMIEAPIPAGCEAFDESQDDWDWWSDQWYNRMEMRDDRVSVACTELDSGESEFTVPLRLTAPGSYILRPVQAFNMYDTAIRGVSKSLRVTITDS
jgi:uncharacterized protein YfaS (alpha-2-macroglobulin family)